jgi:hypothetical protein
MTTTSSGTWLRDWPNLQRCGVKRGTKIKTKLTENVFNEIIAEDFPNPKE